MNGNNSWQRMSPFASFPKHDLGSIAQRQPLPSRELVSMGQLMEGGDDPFQEGMPIPAIPQQQDYGEGRAPQGKKILGMPKDRFIALMGTIAQAFGGESPSGRMGAGLINMADMMREERIGKGKAQAEMAETRRKETAEAREKARTKKEKIPSSWEAFYREKKGQVDPKTNRPWTEAGIYTAFKKVGAKKPTVSKGQAGFNEIDGTLHKGFWHLDTERGEYIFAPSRIATAAEKEKTERKPAAGEKPKEMTYPEKRARAKVVKESEAIILNPEYQSAEYQNELQMEIDQFERYSDKPYTYQLTPGKVIEWGRDIPLKVEKVDISTPEKVRDSNLPVEMKLRLLKTRFGYE